MPHERMDLSRRADPAELAEWMDEPCSYEEFHACLADIVRVNRVTSGYRPTLRWLDELVAKRALKMPLHIVDVGCGGGDMLFAIAAWARRRGVAVRLTGIDLNPYAARAVREMAPVDCKVEWITGDAFSYVPSEGIDVVVSSLFTHHLGDRDVARFLAWMEGVTARGWFINDLYRSQFYLRGFQLLAGLFRWHGFVRHDGPVSFRRSFRRKDWERLCIEAGLESEAIHVEASFPGRLCVGRLK